MSSPLAHQSRLRYLSTTLAAGTNGTDASYDDDSVVSGNMTMWGNESTSTPTTEPEADPYYSNKWLLILPRLTAVISLFAIVCVAIEAWKDLAAAKSLVDQCPKDDADTEINRGLYC